MLLKTKQRTKHLVLMYKAERDNKPFMKLFYAKYPHIFHADESLGIQIDHLLAAVRIPQNKSEWSRDFCVLSSPIEIRKILFSLGHRSL